MPLEKLKNDIGLIDSKAINKPGKIYLYKNYIFINNQNYGVHIIDNSDSKKPVNKAFLKIPLNEDISIKNDILYADTMGDLVAINISDINKINVTKRIYIDEFTNNSAFNIDRDKGVQIGYKRTGPYFRENVCGKFFGPQPAPVAAPQTESTGVPNTGQGGSLARFSIVGDYLYTVSNSSIHLYNIKVAADPTDAGTVIVDGNRRDIETIYSYKNKLFMGSSTGAYIYDNTNPQQPTFITKVEHTRSCDPVVAEGDKAFVTLRGGSRCQNFTNQLDIIDFADIQKAKIIKSYPMTNPWGLAIKSGNLFVCDGSSGLKIFDAKDPLNLKQITSIEINNPMDIILNDNNQGIVVSKDGLHQYDFTGLPDKTNFEELSSIKVENKDILDEKNVVKEGNTYYYKWYKEYFDK